MTVPRPVSLPGVPPVGPAGSAAVFLDRDGVLIENRDPYVCSESDIKLLPGAIAAVRKLNAAGIPTIVVTNQAGIERGVLKLGSALQIHRRVLSIMAAAGALTSASYLCPHAPETGCRCRKPRAGMVELAGRDYSIDLARSWIVGDAITDLRAGAEAGLRGGYLVRTGRGAAQLGSPGLAALPAGFDAAVADDLGAAVTSILRESPIARLRPPGEPDTAIPSSAR